MLVFSSLYDTRITDKRTVWAWNWKTAGHVDCRRQRLHLNPADQGQCDLYTNSYTHLQLDF